MYTKIKTNVNQINLDEWKEIEGIRTIGLSIEMLRTLAIARPKRCIYPMVYKDERLIAGTISYFLEKASSPSRWLRLDMLMQDALETGGSKIPDGLDLMVMPTLQVGAHASNDERLLILNNLSREERLEAISTLLVAAEKAAKDDGCKSINLPYVNPEDHDLTNLLFEHGYISFPSLWSCIMDVKWTNFDEYLDSFKSRRRGSIRRERRMVSESDFIIAEEPLTEELAKEFEVLKGNVDAKYHGEGARQPLTDTSYTLVLAQECSDKTFAITARQNGELIGCIIAFIAGDTIISAIWGGDYDALGSIPVYYEIVYYRILEYAMKHGLRRVEIGAAAYQAKLARGFQAMRNDAYVKVFDLNNHQILNEHLSCIENDKIWQSVRANM